MGRLFRMLTSAVWDGGEDSLGPDEFLLYCGRENFEPNLAILLPILLKTETNGKACLLIRPAQAGMEATHMPTFISIMLEVSIYLKVARLEDQQRTYTVIVTGIKSRVRSVWFLR